MPWWNLLLRSTLGGLQSNFQGFLIVYWQNRADLLRQPEQIELSELFNGASDHSALRISGEWIPPLRRFDRNFKWLVKLFERLFFSPRSDD